MRNQDRAHRKVGVSVSNSELSLCGRILVGDSAITEHTDYGEAAMPGPEVSTPSFSSTFWAGEARAGQEAQPGDRPIAADVGASSSSPGGHLSAKGKESTGRHQSATTKDP